MDITRFETRLLGFGLTQDQVDELKAAAAKLPPGIEDGSLISIPQLPGLTAEESELFMARLLDRMALELGMSFDDPDLYDDLGFPTLEDLVKRAQKQEKSDHVGRYERV